MSTRIEIIFYTNRRQTLYFSTNIKKSVIFSKFFHYIKKMQYILKIVNSIDLYTIINTAIKYFFHQSPQNKKKHLESKSVY